MKLALAMIVAARDSEAELLHRCLENVSPYVDKIFITITGHNALVEKVAKKHKAVISHFNWINDFAAARNFNFSQVPKEYDYILWCDADDIFRNLDKLKATMEKSPSDAYSMFYLYAFDEYNNPVVVHPKTQVVRNDGCVEWAGALHEDFKENRQLTVNFIKGIERLHLSKDERFAKAKERNLEIAQAQAEKLPNDPRSYFNLGNALSACEKHEEAITAFDRFMETSQSDDEKYIANLRLAEAYWFTNRKQEAINKLRFAIGLKPEYPDAYIRLGAFLIEQQDAVNAVEYLKTGLSKKPPYYQIIVYNPRDYDYVPLMMLAKAYFQLSLPTLALACLESCAKIYPDNEKLKDTIAQMQKEADRFDKMTKIVVRLKKIKDGKKLAKEMDKIPEEFKAHPEVCRLRNLRLIKKTSSGKDIVFYCAYTTEEWTPLTAETKGIGGSEEAIINLTEQLVKRGWNVTVYNNCGHKELMFDGVRYKPFWMFNYRDKQDVAVIWRHPLILDYDVNAAKIIVDLHDVLLPGEFTASRLEKIDKIFVKSHFHRSLYPDIPDDKFVIIPNGINASDFTQKIDRDENLMINTSSPDRSLRALVDCWPEIKKAVPDAKCYWAYGWSVFDSAHAKNPVLMEWKNKLIEDMEKSGIVNLGRLGHKEINKLYQRAKVFGYPSEFAEIDCISLTKAIAGGAIPVSSDFSALGEKQKYGGLYVKSDKTKDNWCENYQHDFSITNKAEWTEKAISAFKKDIKINAEQARKDYDWPLIAKRWEENICLITKS